MKELDFRTKLVLFCVGLFLIIFSLYRVALLLIYWNTFNNLSNFHLFIAFIDGIRFDLCTFATLFSIPVFFLNFPIPKKEWFYFWGFLFLIELFIGIAILGGDLVFFGFVKRHLALELILTENDVSYVVSYALHHYLFEVILWIISFLIFVKIWLILVNRWFKKEKIVWWKEILRLGIFVAFCVLAIMGKLEPHGKPINIVDAYRYPEAEYGNLVLNGIFTTYQSIRSSKNFNYNFMKPEEAIKIAQEVLIKKDEKLVNPGYPLMRIRKNFYFRAKKRYNLVILLMESWTAKYIDSFSGNHYGVTPNFDKLAKDGIKFINFYANGQRSVEGIAAVLTGVFTLPGLPYLGKGLELSDIVRIGRLLKAYGYHSIFIQTSKRRSFRMDGIASALGFDEYYGEEDIPMLLKYNETEKPAFGYDYEGLMFLKKKLDEIKKPFIAFFFSGTTHPPFVLLDKRWEKFPHDPEGLNGYLNTLYYSDWALGKFFESARKSSWFKDTIFIITGDHTVANFRSQNSKENHWVPLLIYAPYILPSATIKKISSHLDILPTIIDLLNLKIPYTALGRSLFSNNSENFAIFNEGNMLGILNKEGYLKCVGKKVIEKKGFNKQKIEREKKILFSLIQSEYYLLKENRWFIGETGK
jgi:phosphoglycerol transferase MdoB-like AlkP superfamily enzyme